MNNIGSFCFLIYIERSFDMVSACLSIFAGLYFLFSVIGMSILLDDAIDDHTDISFGLFIFGILVFPIALIIELYKDNNRKEK